LVLSNLSARLNGEAARTPFESTAGSQKMLTRAKMAVNCFMQT
jgi:hypothetical protein